MQYRTLTLAFAATLASAQNLGDLPQCAEGPALQAIGSTGCQLTDFSCICKDQQFLTQLQPQIQAACSPSDLQKALQFAQQTCASAGVTLSIPPITGATGGTGISSAPAASTSASASGSGTASGTVTGTPSITLGPGPVITGSSNSTANITSPTGSALSSLVSAATSLASSIASANATATASGSGASGSGSGSGGATGSGAAGGSSSASVSTAGAAAFGAGTSFVVGLAGWLLAL